MKLSQYTLREIMEEEHQVSIIHDILPIISEQCVGTLLTQNTIREIQDTVQRMILEMYMFSDKYIICTPVFEVNLETCSLELTDIVYKKV